MPGCIHAVSLEQKKTFQNPSQGQSMKISLLVWAWLLFFCLWSTKGEVYNHTTVFKFLWRGDLSQQRSCGSHLGNTYLMYDLLESEERRLKPKCFTVGKTRTCLFIKLHFQGDNIPILWSGLAAIPKLYLLFVWQHQHLWPIPQKAASTCFHTRHGWTSKLGAPESSFGTSLGPVINFPCCFS